MGGLRWWGRRLEILFRKRSAEEELDEEIRFHIDREIELHRASGMSPEEARRRALVAFGGVERHKEEVRDVRGARALDDLVQDVRVALRSFAKQPAFLLTVLVTLGLGVGGSVAMFGILDATLVRPLPYQDPERLVLGRVTYDSGQRGNAVSAPDYYDVREQASSFAELAAFAPFSLEATLTGSGDPERVLAPYASTNLFRTLGVDPGLGRHFLPEEGEPGAEAVVILSHGYWERRFEGSPDAVGRAISLDGAPATVVGVLPSSFRFQIDADIWRPMIRGGPFAQARQFHNFVMVGRLARREPRRRPERSGRYQRAARRSLPGLEPGQGHVLRGASEGARGERPRDALGADRRRAHSPARRMRERRGYPACARQRPPRRDGRARGHGCGASGAWCASSWSRTPC